MMEVTVNDCAGVVPVMICGGRNRRNCSKGRVGRNRFMKRRIVINERDDIVIPVPIPVPIGFFR